MDGAPEFVELFPPPWRPFVVLAIFALGALTYYVAYRSVKPKKKQRH